MIEGIPVVGLTAPALLLLAVLLVLTGKIVPRSTYQDQKEEADRWRQAYENERAARALTDAQTRELLEVAKTSDRFIRGVLENSERIRNPGEKE